MARKRNTRGAGMYNPVLIEEYFKKYINNLPQWLPDGVLQVDIELLQRYNLLNFEEKQDPGLTRFFHVMESTDKVTLVNDQFVIWIVPDNSNGTPMTYVLIALNRNGIPQLETAFTTSDVYNTSRLVLRILEKLLFEIQENEDSLKPYREAS